MNFFNIYGDSNIYISDLTVFDKTSQNTVFQWFVPWVKIQFSTKPVKIVYHTIFDKI